jgi:hypothetical protein
MNQSRNSVFGTFAVLLSVFSAPALAHVKWFSQSANLKDLPLALNDILTPTFFALAALSVVTICLLALLDDPLQRFEPYTRLRDWLRVREDRASIVMRIATGMSLLLCWGANTVLAPDLTHSLGVVSWLQFIAILCLMDSRTTHIAGGLVWTLYAVGIYLFGLFHMLDYAAYLGVGFYLMFRNHPNASLRAWVKPILFSTTGFSLGWLALEKWVYPTWGLVVLEQNPVLGLNLPPKFFLSAAAFIEFSLGFLLFAGVLGRPLALIITGVFFLTTMVFGKDEVVGHLILHGILIVFMLEGTTGPKTPPFRFHRRLPLRMAFLGVNFVLALAAMLFGYQTMAGPRTVVPLVDSASAVHSSQTTVAVAPENPPTVAVSANRSEQGQWVLDIQLERFRISPSGKAAPNEGHVHFFVDGELKAMVFSPRHTLESLPPGPHTLTVQLSGPDHQTLLLNGAPIQSSVSVTEPR